jgi:thiol-disulfide isomerase/thioredoxin
VKRGAWIALALVCILAGAWFGMHRANPPSTPPSKPPSSAAGTAALFASTLADSSGKPTALAQWQGKPLVVNFWATWCAPCVEEMPELSALQAELQPRQIQILGIGVDTAANIAAFADKYHIAYPVYVAGIEGSELSRQLGNSAGGLPFTVLIGADGQVKKTWLGRLKMQELRRELAAVGSHS